MTQRYIHTELLRNIKFSTPKFQFLLAKLADGSDGVAWCRPLFRSCAVTWREREVYCVRKQQQLCSNAAMLVTGKT
jgi:hypothetical protein